MNDNPQTTPEDFEQLMADWMVEHGPDGHCDGHDIIAKLAWEYFVKNQKSLLQDCTHALANLILAADMMNGLKEAKDNARKMVKRIREKLNEG